MSKGIKPQDNGTDTPALEALIEQDKRQREQAVIAALEQLAKQYKCSILPVVTIEGTNVAAGLKVVAL